MYYVVSNIFEKCITNLNRVCLSSSAGEHTFKIRMQSFNVVIGVSLSDW
jgi:hypothetical protein